MQNTINGKICFVADDTTKGAARRVTAYYNEWKENESGSVDLIKIIYLLKNTVTDHKDHWAGGWESRLWTQCKFLNELGLLSIQQIGKILAINFVN